MQGQMAGLEELLIGPDLAQALADEVPATIFMSHNNSSLLTSRPQGMESCCHNCCVRVRVCVFFPCFIEC